MNKAIVIGNSLITTASLIKCLGEQGVYVAVIREPSACKLKKKRRGIRSKYISVEFQTESMDDIMTVLRSNFWDEQEKPVLFFGSDRSVSYIDQHWNELKDRFRSFNAKDEQGRINMFLDKVNTFPLAEEAGFNLIRTWVLRQERVIPDDIVYPCLIKGSNSTKSTKADMTVCSSEEELASSLRPGVEYLVQEYIERDFELDVVGLSYNHGRNVYIPAVVRKIRDDLHRQSAYIKLDDVKNYSDLDMDAIKSFIGKIGYEGIFSVELIHAKGGGYYFLEVNLRNDACGYIYRIGGINYPYLWYLYAIGSDVNAAVALLKCNTPKFSMSSEDVKNLIDGKVGSLDFLRDFIRARTFLHVDIADPLPDILSIFSHLKQFVCRMF